MKRRIKLVLTSPIVALLVLVSSLLSGLTGSVPQCIEDFGDELIDWIDE